jgi:phosphate-selective porin OprO/OprP
MKKILARFAGSLTLVVCLSNSAHADNGALMQLIDVLHDNGTINDEAYAKLRAAAAADKSQSSGSTVQETEAPPESSKQQHKAARVEFEGSKVRIQSADKQYRFRLGGRLMADAALYNEDINALGNGSEMRRLRLSWDATLSRNWYLKSSVELAGGLSLKSTYIDYIGFPGTYIRFGNDKEPVTMEDLGSSKYTTFMERAMLTELVPGRHIGLGGGRTGAHWGFSGGLFAGDDEGNEQDEGFGITGRLFYSPWHRRTAAVHLGLSGSYRRAGGSHAFRFRARPESHITDVHLVDTGTMDHIDDITWLGLESALVSDSLSLQAEYLTADVGRADGLSSLRFDGWYAYASWFLTGESRNYDPDDGTFGRITPRHSVGQGGPGAFELGLRFSRLDLTDDDVIGGVEDNLTLGLNWYATPNVRFMANYIKVLQLDRPGSEFDGDTPSVFQIRGQADF